MIKDKSVLFCTGIHLRLIGALHLSDEQFNLHTEIADIFIFTLKICTTKRNILKVLKYYDDNKLKILCTHHNCGNKNQHDITVKMYAANVHHLYHNKNVHSTSCKYNITIRNVHRTIAAIAFTTIL